MHYSLEGVVALAQIDTDNPILLLDTHLSLLAHRIAGLVVRLPFSSSQLHVELLVQNAIVPRPIFARLSCVDLVPLS